ncbi:MAG: hypothetical protein Ta2A_09270 [Treponemataceae bacterium]|nr:MAG: hypothetical protein Ta2A_09270 [Treponemataceae bacterium]
MEVISYFDKTMINQKTVGVRVKTQPRRARFYNSVPVKLALFGARFSQIARGNMQVWRHKEKGAIIEAVIPSQTAGRVPLRRGASAKKLGLPVTAGIALGMLVSYATMVSPETFITPVSHPDSDADRQFLESALTAFALPTNSWQESGDAAGGVSPIDASEYYIKPVTYTTYTVQLGDNISTISKKFSLSGISTLIAVNDIGNARQLRTGQKLTIPSIDGIIYEAKSGDTLAGIAKSYNLKIERLLDVNDLESESLAKGQKLFLPGVQLDQLALRKAMGELFIQPLAVKWRFTSAFGWRNDPISNVRSRHTGIDMAAPLGTPIRAAMSGKVVDVGYSRIYGNYVIINHGNGYQTLYGHMRYAAQAKKGASISQGTRIGYVGSTGYSTGPHLHFSVYKNGKLVDPAPLIR